MSRMVRPFAATVILAVAGPIEMPDGAALARSVKKQVRPEAKAPPRRGAAGRAVPQPRAQVPAPAYDPASGGSGGGY